MDSPLKPAPDGDGSRAGWVDGTPQDGGDATKDARTALREDDRGERSLGGGNWKAETSGAVPENPGAEEGLADETANLGSEIDRP